MSASLWHSSQFTKNHLPSLSLFWKERETSEFAGNKETVRAGLGSPTAVLVDSTNLTAPLGWHSFLSDLQSAIFSASVHPRLLQTGHALFPVLPCSSCGFQGEPGVPSNPARLLLPFSLPNPLVFLLPCLYWIKINSKWKHLHGKLSYVWMELKLLPQRMFCATRETFLPLHFLPRHSDTQGSGASWTVFGTFLCPGSLNHV